MILKSEPRENRPHSRSKSTHPRSTFDEKAVAHPLHPFATNGLFHGFQEDVGVHTIFADVGIQHGLVDGIVLTDRVDVGSLCYPKTENMRDGWMLLPILQYVLSNCRFLWQHLSKNCCAFWSVAVVNNWTVCKFSTMGANPQDQNDLWRFLIIPGGSRMEWSDLKHPVSKSTSRYPFKKQIQQFNMT